MSAQDNITFLIHFVDCNIIRESDDFSFFTVALGSLIKVFQYHIVQNGTR